MKSDVIVSLIKEIVKNEVKQQVKEEIVRLVKSGAVTINSQNKTNTSSLVALTETKSKPKQVVPTTPPPMQPKKEFTKNSVLNEILNMTTPFSAAERAEGGTGLSGMMGGSVLDNIQRESEEDWGTLNMTTSGVTTQPVSNNAEIDAVTKALTRDYSELVKRFK